MRRCFNRSAPRFRMKVGFRSAKAFLLSQSERRQTTPDAGCVCRGRTALVQRAAAGKKILRVESRFRVGSLENRLALRTASFCGRMLTAQAILAIVYTSIVRPTDLSHISSNLHAIGRHATRPGLPCSELMMISSKQRALRLRLMSGASLNGGIIAHTTNTWRGEIHMKLTARSLRRKELCRGGAKSERQKNAKCERLRFCIVRRERHVRRLAGGGARCGGVSNRALPCLLGTARIMVSFHQRRFDLSRASIAVVKAPFRRLPHSCISLPCFLLSPGGLV